MTPTHKLLLDLTKNYGCFIRTSTETTIDPTEISGISWNASKDEFYATKISVCNFVQALIELAYKEGVKDGNKQKTKEILKSLNLNVS
jgi:hypothetical protein